MKKGVGPKIQHKTKASNQSNHNYLHLSNEEYLKRTLQLLGVTPQQYIKQTKIALSSEIFAKNIASPSTSKQFFFISLICIKNLITADEVEGLKMWYPPKSVNEQIQFKKVLFKLLQKLQTQNLLPRNTILGKSVIMGDSPASSIIQFFRILSQLSLRALYMEKYSKNERLIQLAVNSLAESFDNDINKFYVYPFVPTAVVSESPLKSHEEVQRLKKIYSIYIERYRKKILSLKTVNESEDEVINAQTLMKKLIEQKQLSQTFSSRVSKNIFSQNRAFDRRVILEKNQQIWKELFNLDCVFVEKSDTPVLRNEGEISKIIDSWRPVTGVSSLADFNSTAERIQQLKRKCQMMLKDFQAIEVKIKKGLSVAI